jgi:hypothetical protein
MNEIKNSGSADSMPIAGSSCGIKPSKKALDKGYEVDFSKAKSLLEIDSDGGLDYDRPCGENDES